MQKAITNEEFIRLAKEIHGSKYDYSQTVYHGRRSKVKIICVDHGPFEQQASFHIRGPGTCPTCANKTRVRNMTKNLKFRHNEFINHCIQIHGDRYDYSRAIYNGALEDIEIICKKHGAFWQRADFHKNGSNCPLCGYNISYSSQQWLDSLGNPNILREHKICGFRVDGFDPNTRTVYEFYGDFWHGNPSIYKPTFFNKMTKTTMGFLLERTKQKEEMLRSSGFEVVSIWEADWKRSLVL